MKPAPLLASLALVALVAVLFYPALFQGRILAPLDITTTLLPPWNENAGTAKPHNQSTSDAVTQYIPYRIFIEESLRKDGYIGWNPYEMGGYSMAANTMALPGNWTHQLHRFLPFKDAWNWGIFAEFLIAGFGMLAFLRSRRIGWLACLVGAVAFMLNAQFIIWIHHRWALSSFCWMPWLLWSAVDWKGLPDLTPRRCLLPIWIALALMGASLQHMIFVFLVCVCLFLASWLGHPVPVRRGDILSPLFPRMLRRIRYPKHRTDSSAGKEGETWPGHPARSPYPSNTLHAKFPSLRELSSHLVKLTASWALVWFLAVGMAAFTLIPQIEGFFANIETGHIRGQIGYEHGPSQILYHLLLIPARIWPWLAGDPQSLDGFRLLKSYFMNLNYIGTIPMLLGFAALFVRSMPRAAKFLIISGLVLPLTPLVGPLYHRVELLFILGACWITAELLHHLTHNTKNKIQSTKHSSADAQPTPAHVVSSRPRYLPAFPIPNIQYRIPLIALPASIGLILLTGALLPSGIRTPLENKVVALAVSKSNESQFGADKQWIASRAREWTSRFSLLHPKTAWTYSLLILGCAGLYFIVAGSSSSSMPALASRFHSLTTLISHLPSPISLLLILTATTLELSTLFHGWCTFSDPAHLTVPHPAIETIRERVGPHRIQQYSPDAGFTDIFATPNLLASRFIPSIDGYESIQYRSSLVALSEAHPADRLNLAGVSLAVHPNNKPRPPGTETWTDTPHTATHTLLTSPYTPPPIALGHGEPPTTTDAILDALSHASPIQPLSRSPNRITFSLPSNYKAQSTRNGPQASHQAPSTKHSVTGASWLRFLQNWHPGWKWRTSGSSVWCPFRNGPDAACWIDSLPHDTHSIEIRFFPRSPWISYASLGIAMAWIVASVFRYYGWTIGPVLRLHQSAFDCLKHCKSNQTTKTPNH